MVQEGYITVGAGQLHYLEMGRGSKLLLAFHGYADDAKQFIPLAEQLQQEYKIISVNLPHHGKTTWPKDKVFDAMDLLELVNGLMTKYNADGITLVGFSMGGRICLKIGELMPGKVDKMLLIAPDGLVFNPLYFFVTKTVFGKKLFGSFLKDPSFYIPAIKILKSVGIIDNSRQKFATLYLQNEESRRFVWDVWQCMRELSPNNNSLNKVAIYIFAGKYDRVIKASYARRFQKGKQNTQVYILDKGHKIIDDETIPLMAECLLN